MQEILRQSSDEKKIISENIVTVLSQVFIANYPRDAARKIELMSAKTAVEILISQTKLCRQKVWCELTITTASRLIILFDDNIAIDLLSALDAGICANLLSRLNKPDRDRYLRLMNETLAQELEELLMYPDDSAGFMMDTGVITFDLKSKVAESIEQLKFYPGIKGSQIYLVNSDKQLAGQINIYDLITADSEQILSELSQSVKVYTLALEPKEEAAEKLQKYSLDRLPVVDVQHRLLGVIRGADAIDTVAEDIAGDLQTMVGASRDEQALSSSFFAVRKRHGWLQINLLTCFLAATVVGVFEQTIAQFTALAVLMPIAAGQSGNTGAQALAVTMRGLTLREITTRNWLRVMLKESVAGLLNGLGIALTCGLGVYLWSQSLGLTCVIASSILISMTIAGMAGALVPMLLKKMGQDPAQSSSIILTTITDIVGFISFLGIATLLAQFLV